MRDPVRVRDERARRARHHASAAAALALVFAAGSACTPPEPARAAPTGAASAGRLEGGLAVVDPPDPTYPVDVGLGEIAYGEVIEHTVRLANTEARPLTILKVTPGCSCTAPRIAYTAPDGVRTVSDPRRTGDLVQLPPGGVAEVLLSVDSKLSPSRNAPKRVLVRIETDSQVDPYLTLEVHFTVVFPFQITPAILQLGQVAVNGGGAGHVDIVPIARDGGGERIADVLECPDGLDCSLVPVTKAGVDLWQLHVRWHPPLALGNQTQVVRLSTTGPGGRGEGRPVEVKVIASGVPDVAATPTRLVFPRPDEPTFELATVEIETRLSGQRLAVRRGVVRGEGERALALEFVPLDPDRDGRATRIQVRLTLDPESAPESFSGTVAVEFEGADPLEIPYVRLAR